MIYGNIMRGGLGLQRPLPLPSPTNPSAAKLASQGNVHVKTNAKLNSCIIPCMLTYILENDV